MFGVLMFRESSSRRLRPNISLSRNSRGDLRIEKASDYVVH
jgi:hypothetical protein